MPRKSEAPSSRRALDPRPARTREALFEALRELMMEKRWERIRVQDILDRSGLGRSTFYAHFDSKFDLLTAAIPDVVLPIAASGDDVPDLMPLFEHVQEMHPVLRPLMSQSVHSEVTDAFHRQLASSWLEHLEPRCTAHGDAHFAAELLAGGLLATAKAWVLADCDRPASAVCGDFERYAAAVINEATRG